MNIGIIIGRFGDIDGVSLETQKWIDILQKMGHKIFILTGRYIKNDKNLNLEYTILPALSFFSPECEWEQRRAFFYPSNSPDQLLDHLERTSTNIAKNMFEWKMNNKIDLLISENASALPCHLSMGMAIQKFVENTNLKIITHDHDFAWERGDRYKTPFSEIQEITEKIFPMQLPNARHAVINSIGQKTLKEKYGVDSIVVPNVMDFNEPYGVKDDYNSDLYEAIGVNKNDLLLFQVTRIVERKGIETAIELLDRLDIENAKLVITGSKADDERFGYYYQLLKIIDEKKLQDKVVFGEKRIMHYRDKDAQNQKIYSLSDAYANATACTYFSTYEGFGNAFLESVLAKKPIFVNNYKPVYWPDIGSKGFEAVMTEDSVLTDDHVNKIREIITNKKRCEEIGEFNFKIGKKYFSYEVLEELLTQLIESL